ncbi:P-loop containing nucleoside triphosphate hydrolase protein [Dentipellis sp. KUC8613]|nr:P-loop containing nucleoside triphosphate hydrolase protein [Dentipellis sp. KUC8613]
MSTPPAPVPPPAHTPSPSPLPVLNADGSIPAADDAAARVRTRVVLVGIGGATCSGKTTLAKHLRAILPNSFIIHQDDFAPPESTLPLHPTLHVQDWDSAPTALAWPRLRAFLRTAKRAATLPPDHHSHDHLNAQRPVPVGEGLAGRWAAQFRGVQERLEAGAEGVHVVWGLVDGFLLYWDPEVVETLDAKFFLRVPRATLEARRVERSGYYTAEGGFWRDPPGYFEQLVWPAYVAAHEGIFENHDVVHGAPTLPGLVLIEPLELPMDAVIERCCEELKGVLDRVVAEESGGKA